MTLGELERMHISDIILKANIAMNEDTIMRIWKKDEKYRKEGSAYWELSQKKELVRELVNDNQRLYQYLFAHNKEIDKLMYLAILYNGYTYSLESNPNMTDKQKSSTKEAIEGIRELFKGIDETIIFKKVRFPNGPIEGLTILHTRKIAEGNKQRKNTNFERLNELKKEIHFRDVVQSLFLSDVRSITSNSDVGNYMQHMILENTLLKKYGQKQAQQLEKEKTIDERIKGLDREDYIDELIKVLESYIEEIDIDKLLLFLAYRYIQGVQDGESDEKDNKEVKTLLETMMRHIKKKPQIIISDEETYSKIEFQKDMNRFINVDGTITYLSKKRIDELKDKILKDEMTLNDILLQEFELIRFTTEELRQITKNNPENYIFLLNNDKNNDSKETTLTNIINKGKCSTELLKVICDFLNIDPKDIYNLFAKEVISVNQMKEVREKIGRIITDEVLFEKYKEYKACEEDNEKKIKLRVQLERHILAYRNTEVIGKTQKEQKANEEQFIEKYIDEIEAEDLILLYKFNVISLDVVAGYGGDETIIKLIESGNIKPADAKKLKEKGLLNENAIRTLFITNPYMPYCDQISLVFAVYDGNTEEEKNIRERLSQYYNIEGVLNNRGDVSKSKPQKVRSTNEEKDEKQQEKTKVKMRDPGAKFNFLLSFDKDTRVESGIIDGHIIVHYPNVNNGIVIIEKLHKIKKDQKNNTREILPDNKAATYILSEEEFIEWRDLLIKDGKVERSVLSKKWMRDPEHWLAHNGNEHWEKELLKMFGVEKEDSRYSEEEKERIKNLAQMSIKSKTESR